MAVEITERQSERRGEQGISRPVDGFGFRMALVLALFAAAIFSLSLGASDLGPMRLLHALFDDALSAQDQIVLYSIRLPRLGLGIAAGAGLAVSGVLLQGLFRNPLADPTIVGVSSGASLGAVAAIVLGGLLPNAVTASAGVYLVPLAAGFGAWAFTMVLYRIASSGGRTDVAKMLLAGLAIGALASAVTGAIIFLADDTQLRDLTFWSMGSLAGATWAKIGLLAPIVLAVIALQSRLGSGLNALALGEAQATHMGHPVETLKRQAILGVALATGGAVALTGGIAFVGIIVPHLLRLWQGPDHRKLLPHAALLGAIVLVLADVIARSIVAPAELPIGIVTAVLGAPVFLWILLRQNGLSRG